MLSRDVPSGKRSVITEIGRFNQGRDPERLALKYKALRANAFSFLRCTRHLFWSEATKSFWAGAVPLAWTCDDLHLQNFGCYKGDNRLVYFAVNDFDEAVAAPCYCDPVRLMSSIMVATKEMQIARRRRTLKRGCGAQTPGSEAPSALGLRHNRKPVSPH